MTNNDLLNYHELNLKSVSQMTSLRRRIDPAYLKPQVIQQIGEQSSFFGLLYLIGLEQKLKINSDRNFDQFFKGAFYKRKTPFLIGVSGAVSVGKSTFAKNLAASLRQINPNARIEVVSTDNFLYSNTELMQKDLMEKKGFPESFDNQKLWQFLINAASFNEVQEIPIYDHQTYDILTNKQQKVRAADFLIIEGINAFQINPLNQLPFCETMDITIYLNASNEAILDWFVQRFDQLLDKATPGSFYEQYAKMDRNTANKLALATYAQINQPNFEQNIAPSLKRAKIIIQFEAGHQIKQILMRDY